MTTFGPAFPGGPAAARLANRINPSIPISGPVFGGSGSTGLTSLTGPLSLGFGATMGVLGFLGARARNRAIREQARETFRRLDEQVTRARVETLDRIRMRSEQAQTARGQTIASFGGQSGISFSERLASMAGDVALDTDAIIDQGEQRLQQLEHQRVNVARQAESQMQRPGVAALTGAVGGAQMGFQFGGMLDAAREAAKAREHAEQIRQMSGEEHLAQRAARSYRTDFWRNQQMEQIRRNQRALQSLDAHTEALRGVIGQ